MGRYVTVATKLEVLEFIAKKEIVNRDHLIQEFNYTPGAADVRLCRLEKQRLIERMSDLNKDYCLTTIAYERLEALKRGAGKTNAQLLKEVETLRDQITDRDEEIQKLKKDNSRLTDLLGIKRKYS